MFDATGIALIITALGGLAKVWLDIRAGNKLTVEGNKKTEEVKVQTEEVRAIAAHTLVLSNGRMLAALKSIALLARALAEITKEPKHLIAAEEAESELHKKYEQDRVGWGAPFKAEGGKP